MLGASVGGEARFVILWTAVMILVGFATMQLFRPFLAATWLDRLLADLPGGVRSFLGITPLATPAQFLDGVVFGFFAPVVFMTFGIGVGSRAGTVSSKPGAAPEATDPMPARGFVPVKIAALALGAVVIGAGTWLGIMAGAQVANAAIDPGNVTAGIGADVLLGVAIGAIALLARVLTGSLALAGWIATAVALAADGLRGLGAAIAPIADVRYASLLYYADGEPASRGITAVHELALLGVTVAVSALAIVGLRRRDRA